MKQIRHSARGFPYGFGPSLMTVGGRCDAARR